MTTQDKHGAAAGTEELRQEVDRARHDLGETVEQLAAKADVKAMARQKAAEAKDRMRETATSAREVGAWAKGAGASESARRGGVVIVSAGALAAVAVLMRRRAARSRPTTKAKLAAKAGLGAKKGLAAKTGLASKKGLASKAGLGSRKGLGRGTRLSPKSLSPKSMPGSGLRPGRGRELRLGRGRDAPVRVVFRTGQKRPVQVRRRRMPL